MTPGREGAGVTYSDSEQVARANTAFYEALERGDLEALSGLWLEGGPPGHTAVGGGAAGGAFGAQQPPPDDDDASDVPVDVGAGAPTCVHPGWPVLTGRGEVLRSFALIMANTEYIQFFLTDVMVSVSGDTALVTCTENILSGAPSEEEDELGPLVGQLVVATNVFRRTSAGWKLWSHHASPVLAEGSPGGDGDGGDDGDEGDGAEPDGATPA